MSKSGITLFALRAKRFNTHNQIQLLKCHYDQIIDIHFFLHFSYTMSFLDISVTKFQSVTNFRIRFFGPLFPRIYGQLKVKWSHLYLGRIAPALTHRLVSKTLTMHLRSLALFSLTTMTPANASPTQWTSSPFTTWFRTTAVWKR